MLRRVRHLCRGHDPLFEVLSSALNFGTECLRHLTSDLRYSATERAIKGSLWHGW